MRMKTHFAFLVLMALLQVSWSWAQSTSRISFRPEQVGGTQHSTGHVNAAEMFNPQISKAAQELGLNADKAIHRTIMAALESPDQASVQRIIANSNLNSTQRAELTRIVNKLQENGAKSPPKVVMVGGQALATDGHHRVRGQAKFGEIMEEANRQWPIEVGQTLDSLPGRTGANRFSLPYEIPFEQTDSGRLVARLPANASMDEVMQVILTENKGIWRDPALSELAQRLRSNGNLGAASSADLQRLAAGLGLRMENGRLISTPVVNLPDDMSRSLVGNNFFTRGVTSRGSVKGVEVVQIDYVEFHVADDIKGALSRNGVDDFPNLRKLMSSQNLTPDQQNAIKALANAELDELMLREPSLREGIINRTVKLKEAVAANLDRSLFKSCVGRTSPGCTRFMTGLSSEQRNFLESLQKFSDTEVVDLVDHIKKNPAFSNIAGQCLN